MTTPIPATARNLDGYGAPEIPWGRVRDRLDLGLTQAPGSGGPNRHTCWLTTMNADGRPHVMPLGALWSDGVFYFNSGVGTHKAQNLAANPHCVLSVATDVFDLVFEGTAVRITDPAKAERVAALYRAQGWEATVSEGAASLTAPYSAPAAGPPPWDVYEFMPETVYALSTSEPGGATRYRF